MTTLSPQRILIVEDEAKIAALLADYLQAAGFETQVLDDGAQALTLLRQSPPALLVLDLMLPGLDGLSLPERATLCSRAMTRPTRAASTRDHRRGG